MSEEEDGNERKNPLKLFPDPGRDQVQLPELFTVGSLEIPKCCLVWWDSNPSVLHVAASSGSVGPFPVGVEERSQDATLLLQNGDFTVKMS